MRVTRDGTSLVAEQERKWIDVVTCGPNGAMGFAAGSTVWVATQDLLKQFDHDRAVEGIAFAPKGMRIACARYQDVSMHWVASQAAPVGLHWDDAHTGVIYSPDGRYVVTSMAENALHGWRLNNVKTAEGAHAYDRLSGHAQKPVLVGQGTISGQFRRPSGNLLALCRQAGADEKIIRKSAGLVVPQSNPI